MYFPPISISFSFFSTRRGRKYIHFIHQYPPLALVQHKQRQTKSNNNQHLAAKAFRMAKSKTIACKNCESFDPETSECRAKPPVADPRGTRIFPKVMPDDWCGEFKERQDWETLCRRAGRQ